MMFALSCVFGPALAAVAAEPSRGPEGASPVLHIRCGAACDPGASLPWYQDLDESVLGDGYDYSVEGSVYSWGTVGCWFFNQTGKITLHCPKSTAGVLYLQCLDSDSNQRAQSVSINGKAPVEIGKFGPPEGKWVVEPLTTADTAHGTVTITIRRMAGANAVVSRIDFLPTGVKGSILPGSLEELSAKEMIEADWQRQEVVALRQLWLGGRLGFAAGDSLANWQESERQWPGLGAPGGRVLPLPIVAGSPTCDGRLDEDCWSRATRLTSPLHAVPGGKPDDSVVYLSTDGKTLFVGLETTAGRRAAFVFGGHRVHAMTDETVLVNGRKAAEAGVQAAAKFTAASAANDKGTKSGRLVAEVALPLYHPGPDGKKQLPLLVPTVFASGTSDRDVRAIQAAPLALIPAEFGIAWQNRQIAPGRCRVELKITTPGKLSTPVEVSAEVLAAPRSRADNRPLFRKTISSGSAAITAMVDDLAQGPGTVVVSILQKDRKFRDGFLFQVEPVGELLARGRALAHDFAELGATAVAQKATGRLADLQHAADRLLAQLRSGEAPADAWRKLYLQARWTVRELAFQNPKLDFDKLFFVKRFTPAHAHQCAHHLGMAQSPGGDLCVLTGLAPDGKVTSILRGQLKPGGFGRPDLSYDARRVVFPYAAPRAAPTGFSYQPGYDSGLCDPYDLYEIALDGSGLRRLTDCELEDTEPCYLPSGQIVFTSSRCDRFVQCGDWALVFGLYRMDADGSNVRRLTEVKEGEWFPSVMDDGRILYMRWEYMMKAFNAIQYLWSVRPDGSSAKFAYGDHYAFSKGPVTFIEARQVRGTSRVLCTGAAHHNCGVGPINMVDLARPPGDQRGLLRLTPEVGYPETAEMSNVRSAAGFYNAPYPLSDRHYLVCYSPSMNHAEPAGYGIYLADIYGTKELIYRDAVYSCYTPIPLKPRPKPPILPDAHHQDRPDDGVVLMLDVYRGLEGVPRGSAKYLRVLETLPKLVHTNPRRLDVGIRSGWDPRQVLGTVPIEADGSAYFKVPAGKAVFFSVLDEQHREIRRMRSFVNFQPGEKQTCVGCHESGGSSPPNGMALALSRPPVEITPPAWGVAPMSFPKLVQPVLDRHCTACHDGSKGDKKSFDLTAARSVPAHGADNEGPIHNVSASFLELLKYVDYVQVNGWGGGYTPLAPRAVGSSKSSLFAVLDKGHYDVRLDAPSRQLLAAWIDCNAPYLGTWDDYVQRQAGGE